MKRSILNTMKLSGSMDENECGRASQAPAPDDARRRRPRHRPRAKGRATALESVAAVYDRLTAARGPRPAMSPDDAAAALVRRAGVDLDPDAVRAWLYAQEVPPCS